ncbi:hypothetical protein [Micromonospora thermarum]|uniref:hypothetical protein n=1 Tax=Micromonospora thermarum TaxID=2720024 RepID=UPI0028162827|nr:hypothetical protein [Micromonospora thermarum]
MTATSPPAAPRSSWRVRWAERENDRRRRAHAGDAEAWRRRADELTRLRIEATCFLGSSLPPDVPVVRLRRGEVVYRVLPRVELVEVAARHLADLPAPGLAVDPAGTDAPARPLPPGIRAVDAGTAVVTDRRVAFLGRHHQRIWWYADLAGPAHHPRAPLTLLHTTDGTPLAGLLAPPPAALNLRFYLTLAFADGLGNRDAVAACLDDLVAAHQRTRPVAPPLAAPTQAPVIARLHDRRLAGAAAAVAASLVIGATFAVSRTLTPTVPSGTPSPVVVSDVTGPVDGSPTASGVPTTPSPQPDGGSPAHPTGATPPTAPAAPEPRGRRSVGGVPPGGGTQEGGPGPGGPSAVPAMPDSPPVVVPQPPPSDPTPSVPPTPPSSAPTGPDRCGAPANPYGYNYCGGSRIHDPAADVCGWFRCVADFGRGKGHLVRCEDGLIGWVGGPGGTCATHRGARSPVYG